MSSRLSGWYVLVFMHFVDRKIFSGVMEFRLVNAKKKHFLVNLL